MPAGDEPEEGAAEEAPAAEEGAADAAEGEEGGDGAQAAVADMQDGEYLLHVLVETGKSIFLEGETTIDPLVKVTFMGKTASTSAKKGVTRTTPVKWDEHLFLEAGKVTGKEMQASLIQIEVLNKGFFSSDQVGLYSVAGAAIHSMKDNLVHNQQIAFTSPDAEDKGKIYGLVTVSINVTGPGDTAAQLKIGTDPLAIKRKPWMPASVEKRYKQLYFKFIKAEHLPFMDTFGTIDAYCYIDHMGGKLKTSIQTMPKDTMRVHWNQEFLLPLELPASNDIIKFQLYDHDTVARDDLVATLQFSIREMLKTDSSKKPKGQYNYTMKWVNLFGCNADYTGKAADKQNDEIDLASTFKGRVLVEYMTIDEKHPIMKIRAIQEDDAYKRRLEKMVIKKYQLQAEIGAAIALPDSKNYTVRISIGELDWDTGKPKQGKDQKMSHYARWSVRFSETFESPHQHLGTMPRVFIYLMDGKKPICFWRGSPLDFKDPEAPQRWVPFEPDRAVGKVKDHEAGLFQVRMYLHETTDLGEFDPNTIKSWKKPPSKRMNAFKIRAYIYQAESLPPCDATGASDPYIECWTPDEQNIRTAVVEQTNNPLYYETKEFLSEFNDVAEAPPVMLNFFDTDAGWFDSEDDYMGRAVVFLKDVAALAGDKELSTDDRIPVPCWYPVKWGFDDAHDAETGARVLASFACVEYDYDFLLAADDVALADRLMVPGPPPQPLPMPDLNIEEYQIQINVLGLRDLLSTGLLPVRKAYCKFSVKSILPPSQAKAVADIFTTPNEGGSDPNIRTTLKVNANIPADPYYCPRMTCTAYDKLYFEGMAQPILGTFTLKLGEILAATREKDAKVIRELEKLEKILKAALEAKAGEQKDQTILEIVNRLREENLTLSRQLTASQGVAAADVSLQLPAAAAPDDGEMSAAAMEARRAKKEAEAKVLADAEAKRVAEEADRAAAQEALEQSKDGTSNVIYPRTKWDERLKVDREVEVPPGKLFMCIGYNKTVEDKTTKHYRRYYPDELEEVEEVMPGCPFLKETIYRVAESGGGLFGGDSDPSQNVAIKAGVFKGLVKVYNEQRLATRTGKIKELMEVMQGIVADIYQIQLEKPLDFDFAILEDAQKRDTVDGLPAIAAKLKECGLAPLRISEFVSNYRFQVELQKRLETEVAAQARVYMLEGFNFAQKDLFSPSDPYLIVKCGSQVNNERENYQVDNADPTFYKSYDFNISFPGAPLLIVEAYDYDDFFGDDLIGITKLDLDDRYFNKEWQSIENKPIEYRALYHPSSSMSQGTVKMWVEVQPTASKKSSIPALDITPEPSKDYEVRLVIWHTKDIECMDWEGTSDIFVRAFFDPEDDHLTDTHWRCQTGKGSFNWRLKIPTKSKQDSYTLSIQAWDKDIIASNDLIGDFQLDISPLMEDCYLTEKLQSFNKEYWNSYMKQTLKDQGYEHCDDIKWENKEDFWLPMRRFVTQDDGTEELKDAGEVLCSLRIYPKADADKNDQGVGRAEPNNDPFMPEPEGRISLSLNPFTMFNQLVGPAVRRKIYFCLCASTCCALLVMMAPMIGSNVVASWFT